MNPPEAKSRRSNGGNLIMLVEFLPEELITEVLSYLPVKSLMQLRCVCKGWNTLISDPRFINLHLQQSKKKRHLKQILCVCPGSYVLPFPLNTLLNNPSRVKYAIKSSEHYFPPRSDHDYQFIGCCNGLFGFVVRSYIMLYPQNTWFQLWNPATNTFSHEFGHQSHAVVNGDYIRFSGFSFGYDNSTHSYKFVYFRPNKLEIFTFGGNDWKIIQLPHFVPLEHLDRFPFKRPNLSEAVYLNDTISLLARDIAQQIVIISFNLTTDTYCKLLPPQDFVQVSFHLPTIHVLEDSLSFGHNTQNTHFIIWKMTQFGIQDSWTQFLKISYHELDIPIKPNYFFIAPLCLYESGIALVLAGKGNSLGNRLQVILYHWSENRIEKVRMPNLIEWLFNQNYVESLAPTG